MTHKTITVIIAEDHTIVRRGLVALLSLGEGIEVIAEAADGRAALELTTQLEPDVVLMDISMPILNGLEATLQIKKALPHVKVLILSAHDNEEYITQVVRSGANGYLLKNTSAEELYTAIRSLHSGQAFFSPAVSKVIADNYVRRSGPPTTEPPSADESRLTVREREILQMVAEGHTHQKVANLLHISVRTVDTHCNNIMKKLNIHDSAGLVTYAIKNGILILPK